jgi:GNAT superfamily N-acetyltransferase
MSYPACALPYVLRDSLPSDEPWIFSSWLRQLRRERSYELVANEQLFDAGHRRIERLLRSSRTVVAVDPVASENLLGYLCADDAAVHWCYVKSVYRGFGLGRVLLDVARHEELHAGLPIVCSHVTHGVWRLREPWQRRKLVYDPYVLDRDSG